MDWYNENEQRNYPFADNASLHDAKGEEFPRGLIVDMSIASTDIVDAVLSFCNMTFDVNNNPETISLAVTCYIKDSEVIDAQYINSFSISEISPYRSYNLQQLGGKTYGGSCWVVFGELLNMYVPKSRDGVSWSGYAYSWRDMALSPCCVRLIKTPGVTSITGVGTTAKISGIIDVECGSDLEITRDTNDKQRILVTLRNSAKPNYYARCYTKDNDTGVPISTINGVHGKDGIITIILD